MEVTYGTGSIKNFEDYRFTTNVDLVTAEMGEYALSI